MDAHTVKLTQSVVHLTGGFFMINHISPEMARNMWYEITDEQRAEFTAIYGSEANGKTGLEMEILKADHCAAFYNCMTLVGLMWAGWEDVGEFGRIRTLGCVTTKRMREKGFAFARHSDEMRDAFELYEPPEATELYVAIQKSYRQSMEWCVRMCKFTQIGETQVNGEPFVLYRHVHGEGVKR